jgi:hypothetical protein
MVAFGVSIEAGYFLPRLLPTLALFSANVCWWKSCGIDSLNYEMFVSREQ